MDKKGDFEAGRLNIEKLSAAYLMYLKIAVTESNAWSNYWDAELLPEPKNG